MEANDAIRVDRKDRKDREEGNEISSKRFFFIDHLSKIPLSTPINFDKNLKSNFEKTRTV